MTEIKKDTYELEENELEMVSGGTNQTNDCSYFMPQLGKGFTRNCRDCFFYHGEGKCSYPKETNAQDVL